MPKLNKYIDRKAGVLTGKNNLESLPSINNFPVFPGCVETSQETDIFADMNWAIDPETGVIQLTKLVPLDILYQAQHVDGTGPTWQKYYKDFAVYIAENCGGAVLEIGGGSGQLAEAVVAHSPKITWTIVEPNPTHKGSDHIKIVRAFFDKNFSLEDAVDAIVFSQVLEHAYDPREFIATIAGFLKPGGKLIFAYPQLKLWLARKYTNAINFEHTMLLTDAHLDRLLLPEYGFKTLDKRGYNDHSFFYATEHVAEIVPAGEFTNPYTEHKKIFQEFIDYHKELIVELNEKIVESAAPVYLFGAHLFSQYLIAFGLNTEKIAGILDHSPLKCGKRLYGSRFVVEHPRALADKGLVNIILKTGVYNEEIKKDILENINKEVVFW